MWKGNNIIWCKSKFSTTKTSTDVWRWPKRVGVNGTPETRIDSDWFVWIYTYRMVYSLYTPRKSANDWSPRIVKSGPAAYCKFLLFKHFKRCLVCAFSLKCKQTKSLTKVIMAENIPKYPDIGCLTLPPLDEDTKQKPSHFDIDLKRIQMLKVDVDIFSTCLLFAIITNI